MSRPRPSWLSVLAALALVVAAAPARAQSDLAPAPAAPPSAGALAPMSFAWRAGPSVYSVLSSLPAAPVPLDEQTTLAVDERGRASLVLPLGDDRRVRGFRRARGVRAALVDDRGRRCVGRLGEPLYLALVDDPDRSYGDAVPAATVTLSWHVAAPVEGCPSARLAGDLVAAAYGPGARPEAWRARELAAPAATATAHADAAVAAARARFAAVAPKGVTVNETVGGREFARRDGATLRDVVWRASAAAHRGEARATTCQGRDVALDPRFELRMVLDLGDARAPVLVLADASGNLTMARLVGARPLALAVAPPIPRLESAGCG